MLYGIAMPTPDPLLPLEDQPVPHRVRRAGDGVELLPYVLQTFTTADPAALRVAVDEGRFWLAPDGPVLTATSRLEAGAILLARVPAQVVADPWLPPPPRTLSIIYKDDDLLVADKPAGLLSYPMGPRKIAALSIVERQLMGAMERWELRPSHRLDRETSGLLMWARHIEADRRIKKAFSRRAVSKTYLALVRGRLDEPVHVDAPMGPEGGEIRVRQAVRKDGKAAQTDVHPLGTFGDGEQEWSWVQVRPRTGRTHQIRVHLAHLGHPIVGDKIYCDGGRAFLRWWDGDLDDSDLERLQLPRQALHAWTMSLAHPMSGEPLQLRAPLPADVVAFAQAHGGGPPLTDPSVQPMHEG